MSRTVTVKPYNSSNPGCMTIGSRDGSQATLDRITALWPTFRTGGYRGLLLTEGGTDLLDAVVLHGGSGEDNDEDLWSAVVWHEGDKWCRTEVNVERGGRHCIDFTSEQRQAITDAGKTWGFRVTVKPPTGRDTVHLYPCSWAAYRSPKARAWVARGLADTLNTPQHGAQ